MPALTPQTETTADRELLRQGRARCRELASSHYENFAIAGRFAPPDVRQDLCNIYAFSRWADDIADEKRSGFNPLEKLNEFERLLKAAVHGEQVDPVCYALGETIRRRGLPLSLFEDLLAAFRQDLVKTRYDTFAELRGYTRLSADPVGRLVLGVYDIKDPALFAFSDDICTALQLANHWQDVREDFLRGRIYIPREDLARFGVSEEDIAGSNAHSGFRELLKFEVERAERFFEDGKPLLRAVKGSAAAQLELYWRGGKAALAAIRRIRYDVLNRSAKLQRRDKLLVAAGALRRVVF